MTQPVSPQTTRTAECSYAPDTPVASFVAAVEALLATQPVPSALIQGVQEHLRPLLATPDVLRPEHREPWSHRYRSHLLAVAPSKRFSLVALVWLPGQVTPIHDHICWCVVGVLEGLERERRFGLREGADGTRWLVPAGEWPVRVGETSALLPPEENIHQVRNAGDTLAISLHVYGEDIGTYGTSVNQCFDDLPLRSDTAADGAGGEGVPVRWRRVVQI